MKKIMISMYDLRGHLILQQEARKSKINIDISRFKNGIYIVKLNNNAGIFVSKFVKE